MYTELLIPQTWVARLRLRTLQDNTAGGLGPAADRVLPESRLGGQPSA